MKNIRVSSIRSSIIVATLLLAACCATVARPAPLWARGDSHPSDAEVVVQTSVENDDLSVKRSLTPATPSLFQAIKLVLEYELSKNLRLTENELDGIYGDFLCEFVGEEKRELAPERIVVRRTWKLFPQKTGELELPPIPATVSFEDSGKTPIDLVAPPMTISIPALDGKVPGDNGFQYMLDPIPTLSPTKIAALVFAALLIAIVAAAPKLRKKFKEPRQSQGESPFELATRRLNELKASRMFAENSPDFYLIVDDVLRRFLSDEFHIAACEKTSSEILKSIANPPTDSTIETSESEVLSPTQLSRSELAEISRRVLEDADIQKTLRAALESLDRVKFAKSSSSFADASALFQAVQQVVENSHAAFQEAIIKATDEKRRLAERGADASESA